MGCHLASFFDTFMVKGVMQTNKKRRKSQITTIRLSPMSSDKLMISLSTSLFKDFFDLFSHFQDIYDNYVHNLQLSSLNCPNPVCHSNDFSFNTSYYRNVIFSPDHDSLCIKVIVVKCNRCGTYHALLPASLFPFHSYTYQFVMLTMHLYYCSSFRFNKSKVCAIMKIHRSTLNHWIQLFSHNDVESFLNDSISAFLSKLRDRSIDFFDFLKTFNFKYGSFLCSDIHRTYHLSYFSNDFDNCSSP